MPVRAYILATLASIVMVGFSTLVRLPGMIVRRKDQLACEGTWWNQLHISELVEAGHGWARSSVAVVEGVVSPDETGQYDFVLRASSHAHPSTMIAVACEGCNATEQIPLGTYVRARGVVSTEEGSVVLKIPEQGAGYNLVACAENAEQKASAPYPASAMGRKLLVEKMFKTWHDVIPGAVVEFMQQLPGGMKSDTTPPFTARPLPYSAPASGTSATGPVSDIPAGNMSSAELVQELIAKLSYEGSTCPSEVSTPVKTGKFQAEMLIPEEALALYPETYMDSPVDEDGYKFTPMNHDLIGLGDKYCAKPEPSPNDVVMGGVVMFEKDDACYPPPVNADGDSCCQLYAWQPNAEGYYYDNCSMKMDIGADGLWFFISEVPGNETSAGWGADGFPHIHYDLLCRECVTGDVFNAEEKEWYRFKNKFYAGEVCNTADCGDDTWPMPGPEHKALESEIAGMPLYQYNIIVPDKPSD